MITTCLKPKQTFKPTRVIKHLEIASIRFKSVDFTIPQKSNILCISTKTRHINS